MQSTSKLKVLPTHAEMQLICSNCINFNLLCSFNYSVVCMRALQYSPIAKPLMLLVLATERNRERYSVDDDACVVYEPSNYDSIKYCRCNYYLFVES